MSQRKHSGMNNTENHMDGSHLLPRPASPVKDDGAFPYRQLCVLAFCRLAEPIAFVSIIAYSFVMVQEIRGVENASFYSGLLVSAFALAEACTAMFWGQLSDRYGRKPVILIGLAGTALSSLLFGLAEDYWVALFARVVGGLLNGNVAVMQTMVAEMVTRPEHEPKAYAMQPFMWSVGSVLGSALGGFAAKPATYYPGWFSPDGIFAKFPYLLPNLIAVGIILLAMLQGFLLLKETNPLVLEQPEDEPRRSSFEQASLRRASLRRASFERASFGRGSFAASERTPLYAHSIMSRAPSILARDRAGSFASTKLPIAIDSSFDLRRPSAASLITFNLHKRNIPDTANDGSVIEHDEDDSPIHPTQAFNKGVITCIVALSLMAFHQMAYGALTPIYLQDDPKQLHATLDLIGGLGWPLPAVGTTLAVNSGVAIFIQGIVFPIFVDKVGVWRSVMLMTILAPIVYLAAPFISVMTNPTVGVYIITILSSLTTIIIYPCLLIMVKNATESSLVLGKVNGVAMSACSAARTVAPPVLGIVYGAIGSASAWWFCAIFGFIAVVEFHMIPRPRATDDEILRKATITVEPIFEEIE